MRVLVVADDAAVRANLPLLLAAVGDLDVHFAANGSDLARVARERRSDVVIIDIDALGRQRLEALRALRTVLPGIVIIALTLRVYPEYREACLARGVDFFLDRAGEFEKTAEILRFLKRHFAAALPRQINS